MTSAAALSVGGLLHRLGEVACQRRIDDPRGLRHPDGRSAGLGRRAVVWGAEFGMLAVVLARPRGRRPTAPRCRPDRGDGGGPCQTRPEQGAHQAAPARTVPPGSRPRRLTAPHRCALLGSGYFLCPRRGTGSGFVREDSADRVLHLTDQGDETPVVHPHEAEIPLWLTSANPLAARSSVEKKRQSSGSPDPLGHVRDGIHLLYPAAPQLVESIADEALSQPARGVFLDVEDRTAGRRTRVGVGREARGSGQATIAGAKWIEPETTTSPSSARFPTGGFVREQAHTAPAVLQFRGPLMTSVEPPRPPDGRPCRSSATKHTSRNRPGEVPAEKHPAAGIRASV